jgi:hypothetical protein
MVNLNILIGQGSVLGWLSPTVVILAVVFVVSIGFALFADIAMGRTDNIGPWR